MPPIVSSYTPQAKFAMTRSFIHGISVVDSDPITSVVDYVITVTVTSPFIYYHAFVIEPRFWDWNSNCYTLDFFLLDAYYYQPGVTPPTQFAVALAYKTYPGISGRFVEIQAFPAATVQSIAFMPASPSGWWSG